jgi:hypothetical protein
MLKKDSEFSEYLVKQAHMSELSASIWVFFSELEDTCKNFVEVEVAA